MEDDSSKEFIKLPVEERCVHKLWKARQHGYEEATKLFQQIDNEKSPEWTKFLGLIKKFVTDSNAVAQEKGLEATVAFVENCGLAGKTVGEVMAGIVAKCISAPKIKTRELALQIILLYIEIEKHEAVQEELIKGMDHKNPKTVSSCIAAMTQALREFGSKVINIKPLLKKMPTLLEDRDKAVRDETKAMVVEMFRWVGVALKPQLTSLKPVQMTELETEFEKTKGEKVTPSRYLRSQQAKQSKLASAGGAGGEDGNDAVDGSDEETEAPIDPYDLMSPVDILSKLPANFYENVEAKKWQERKEAVDALDTLLQSAPKLESGDYGDLVRALKKIISKDTNVMVVAVAGKCLAGLANGLKKRFQPYAGACIPSLLEKFREKKANVVTAIREAIDAVFLSTTLENIQEDVLAALDNKNPSVKAETAAFLARCFSKSTAVQLNKKLLKAFVTALLKTLNESDPSVRDNSAEALGTALKVVGEKTMMPFVGEVDNLKMAKIKECCEKAVITAKPMKAPSDRPNTAPAKMRAKAEDGQSAPKAVKRPTSGAGATKKPATAAASAVKKPGAVVKKGKETKLAVEKEMSEEEVEERAADLFPADVLSGLCDNVWKTRLSAVEELSQVVRGLDPADAPTQVIFRVLQKKPGLRDTNFQVLKARLEAVKIIAEKYRVSSTAAGFILNDVADKLADLKNGSLASEVLTALAEATKLEYVALQVVDFAFNVQKSPKVQQEALSWLSQAILEFGFVIPAKPLMENVKKGVAATNPAVRTAAIQLIGTLSLYIGQQLNLFFENEKPALLQQIQAEFEKHAGEKPPAPIRGSTKSSDSAGGNAIEEEEAEVDLVQEDILPRVDIGPQLNDSLIQELADKNWKVRNEALQKLTNIIAEARFITGNLGELPPVLAQRLSDSNAKISATALTICQSLGTAMGPTCKQHVRVFFPGFLQCMGDSKVWIRTSAVSCINTYGDLGGYKELFEGEMIADSLKTGSPTLRIEVWKWLAERLPQMKTVSKDELLACLPYLYANFEDRNADVRKTAQEATLGFMIHVGYEAMLKATSSFKPGSRTVIVQILDKVRADLPAKPPPPSKAKAGEDSKAIRGGKAVAQGAKPATAAAASKLPGKSKPGTATGKIPGRKKDEDVDCSPLFQVNNLKTQRSVDEQKLKILKWNFTTPRDEFVELLRDQMTTANMNKGLIANMFHSDFKYHLRAIDSLVEDLADNSKGLTCNLDLILKWMSLRFFDTNPSVLIKGLEYLQTVFNMLREDSYNMIESEASSFIPYLILKVGDPKDAVRNSVRELFKLIGHVYPVSKLFSYIMDGLKSKNARQRTECLDELGYLIENYGVSVCQPNPAAALKEVAKQISDRDNSVRNAALNCVVQAYFLEGEKVYKYVGQISDKDMSLLEERIKRAAKNKPIARVAPANIRQQPAQASVPLPPQQQPQVQPQAQPQAQTSLPMRREASSNSLDDDEDAACDIPPATVNVEPVRPRPRPVSGPFCLDMAFIEQIETGAPTHNAPKLIKFDTHFLEDGSTADPYAVNVNQNVFNSALSNSSLSNSTRASLNTTISLNDSFKTLTLNTVPARDPVEEKLDAAFNQIASSDINRCHDALLNVDYVIQSDKAYLLVPKADLLLISCLAQLRTLVLGNTVYSKSEQAVVCKSIFTVLISFYNQPLLSKAASVQGLHDTLSVIILILAERRLEALSEPEKFVMIVNILVMNIIEKAEHTRVTCALMKLLHESVANGDSWPAKMQELIMKSIWKLVRVFPNWEQDVDYDAILYEVHIFMRDYPTRTWREAQSDIPMRTVKTLLHTMVKQRGSRVLNHMSRIVKPDESELPLYLGKFIKSIKQDDTKSVKKEVKPVPHQRLPKDLHEELTEIFRKIGSKDQTKEGLRLLYDFKKQHTEASIEPFLQKSSQFFQDYIERGLQTIELERRRKAGGQGALSNLSNAMAVGVGVGVGVDGSEKKFGNFPTEKGEENVDIDYYVERLKAFQAQAGLQTAENSSKTMSSPNKFDGDFNFNAELTSSAAPQFQRPSIPAKSTSQELRQRLEELTRSSR